jgi:hypothetical protein
MYREFSHFFPAGGFWLPAVYAPTGVSAQKVKDLWYDFSVGEVFPAEEF